MNLKSKLNRLKGHMQLDSSTERNGDNSHERNQALTHTKCGEDKLAEKWAELQFKPFDYEDQRSYQKRSFYTFEELGYPNLGSDLKEIHERWGGTTIEHPISSKNVPLERMMFFDTETTGLSTGAGNSIFLIGYSRVFDQGIEVTQHILSDPSSEAAFLFGFLQDFDNEDYLVSYNGKSFDWPQVKSRHAFVRHQVPRLPEFGHIDLLHAARRLWKHELPSCRLSIVEKEKLNIHRMNDTPGSMAPLLYFDYLHDKDPKHLEGIIEHNDQDVRSLINLYVLISQRLFQTKPSSSVREQLQLGKWCEQTGWENAAVAHYLEALTIPGHGKEEVHFQLGMLQKKQKSYHEAKEHFKKSIAIGTTPFIDAYIELAKLCEHQEKSYDNAYYYAREALSQLKKSARLTSINKKVIRDIEKRLERLSKKL